jgi:pSer/pThr/pTyr-binding forkhead associated (FHA) protein
VITCPKCSKENQDHYKFCLGCGAELPRGSGAPKPFSTQTPPHGVPAAGAPAAAQEPGYAARPASRPPAAPTPAPATAPTPGPAPAPAAAAAPAAAELECPQCGHRNPGGFKFCASCGYNLSALRGGGSVPAAAPAAAAPAGTPAPLAAAPTTPVTLVALRADGTEAGSYRMPDAATVTLGRDTGSIFAGDSYLSPRHATFTRRGGQLSIKDEASLNGVYLKLKPNEPWPLDYEDVFRIGQEIIRLEPLRGQSKSADGVERFGSPARGYIGRLALVIGRDTTGNAFPVPERGVHCGRERGDILFSEDGYVSGLHCRIAKGNDGKIHLTDVGSSNGTFVRLGAERTLHPGDVLLMGQQLFRVDF